MAEVIKEKTKPDYKKIDLFYKELTLEVTRKCNMKCPHCMRGDAENHTISKEVIDTTLDNVSGIGGLVLTGGEPFLEPEMIDYIFAGIIKRKIPLMNVHIVTNGTIKDERIAKSLNKITDYIANYAESKNLGWDRKKLRTIGTISVSDDSFHEEVDIMDTLKFYRNYLNQHTIITKENKPKEGETERILYLGKATTAKLKENQKYRYTITPYRVSFFKDEEGTPLGIDTMIQIGYDGKVLIGEDSSYKQQDANNYGNILEKPMSQLLADGAFNEPFTEKEAQNHDMMYSLYMNKEYNSDLDEDYCKAFLYIFDALYCERERCHEAYPSATFDEIVDIAYHDMNIGFKEVYGDDMDFRRIDNFELFNTTKEESEKVVMRFRTKYPIETLRWVLARPFLDLNIKPVPDKLTRERYRRFKV